GIYSQWSDKLKINGNRIEGSDVGISLSSAKDCTIEGSTISKCTTGGQFDSNHGTMFKANSITQASTGLMLTNENGNTYRQNSITSTGVSIEIDNCKSEQIKSNTMQGGGIGIFGEDVLDWNTHVIDNANRVNLMPIIYRKNETGSIITSDAAQIILANCTNATVRGQDMSGTSNALQMGFTHGSDINNMTITGSGTGVSLVHCNDNNLKDLDITGYGYNGVLFYTSSNNTVHGSRFSDLLRGVNDVGSSNNTIRRNTMMNCGVWITSHDYVFSMDARVLDNTIIDASTGIAISGCRGTIVSGNRISGSTYHGVHITDQPLMGCFSNDVRVSYNDITGSSMSGILVDKKSTNVALDHNHIHNSTLTMSAIYLRGSSKNIEVNGNLLENIYGDQITAINTVNVMVDNNTVRSSTDFGIVFHNSSGSDIKENIIMDDWKGGILVESSDYVNILNNSISKGTGSQLFGIELNDCNYIIIRSNFILNHSVGLNLYNCDSVLVYDNYFDNDVNHGSLSSSTNLIWNSPKYKGQNIIGGDRIGGNFWNDYSGLDLDGDWLGDTEVPHGPGDFHPLQYDIVPPTIDPVMGPNPVTGDRYRFAVNVVDEREVDLVYVHYRIGDGAIINRTMVWEDGLYVHRITVPDVQNETMNFTFHALDTSGNFKSTAPLIQKIEKEFDEPLLFGITYPKTVLLGQNIPISVRASDNVRLVSVQLRYVLENGSYHENNMTSI
ncbi:MAG: NosD domain-containing protein, partial [Candidatus Thermoplasmatota archaeon]|nr:NosD domain-containing protein [Candidatus Thermoplasmatota archaeon]